MPLQGIRSQLLKLIRTVLGSHVVMGFRILLLLAQMPLLRHRGVVDRTALKGQRVPYPARRPCLVEEMMRRSFGFAPVLSCIQPIP